MNGTSIDNPAIVQNTETSMNNTNMHNDDNKDLNSTITCETSMSDAQICESPRMSYTSDRNETFRLAHAYAFPNALNSTLNTCIERYSPMNTTINKNCSYLEPAFVRLDDITKVQVNESLGPLAFGQMKESSVSTCSSIVEADTTVLFTGEFGFQHEIESSILTLTPKPLMTSTPFYNQAKTKINSISTPLITSTPALKQNSVFNMTEKLFENAKIVIEQIKPEAKTKFMHDKVGVQLVSGKEEIDNGFVDLEEASMLIDQSITLCDLTLNDSIRVTNESSKILPQKASPDSLQKSKTHSHHSDSQTVYTSISSGFSTNSSSMTLSGNPKLTVLNSETNLPGLVPKLVYKISKLKSAVGATNVTSKITSTYPSAVSKKTVKPAVATPIRKFGYLKSAHKFPSCLTSSKEKSESKSYKNICGAKLTLSKDGNDVKVKGNQAILQHLTVPGQNIMPFTKATMSPNRSKLPSSFPGSGNTNKTVGVSNIKQPFSSSSTYSSGESGAASISRNALSSRFSSKPRVEVSNVAKSPRSNSRAAGAYFSKTSSSRSVGIDTKNPSSPNKIIGRNIPSNSNVKVASSNSGNNEQFLLPPERGNDVSSENRLRSNIIAPSIRPYRTEKSTAAASSSKYRALKTPGLPTWSKPKASMKGYYIEKANSRKLSGATTSSVPSASRPSPQKQATSAITRPNMKSSRVVKDIKYK